MLFPKAKVDILFIFVIFFRIFSVPSWIMLGVWFGLQLFNGVGSGAGAGVAYWAHAGGFVVGFVLTLPLWIKHGGRVYWEKTEGHPPHKDAEYIWAQTRVPAVRRSIDNNSNVPVVKRNKK